MQRLQRREERDNSMAWLMSTGRPWSLTVLLGFTVDSIFHVLGSLFTVVSTLECMILWSQWSLLEVCRLVYYALRNCAVCFLAMLVKDILLFDMWRHSTPYMTNLWKSRLSKSIHLQICFNWYEEQIPLVIFSYTSKIRWFKGLFFFFKFIPCYEKTRKKQKPLQFIHGP